LKLIVIIGTLCIGLSGVIYGQNQSLIVDQNEFLVLEQDSSATKVLVRELLLDWVNEGYIYSSLDSITTDSTRISWYLHKGEQFAWKKIRLIIDDSSEYIFRRKVPQTLLRSYASQGFPFVNFRMIEYSLDNGGVQVTYLVNKGVKVNFDSVQVAGENPFRNSALYNVLGFYPGDIYDEGIYLGITERISQLGFVSVAKPIDIGFSGKEATIYLDLKEEKASLFDAVMGMVPNKKGGQVSFVGNVDLYLANLMKGASSFSFKWNAFGQGSQSLKTGIDIPYIGRLGLGMESDFRLLKQDTTFVDVSAFTEIKLRVSQSQQLGINFSKQSNRDFSNAEADYSSFSYSWYGLSLANSFQTPSTTREERFEYKVQFRLGDRHLIESTDLNDSRSLTWSVKGDQVWTSPIAKKGLVYVRSNAGWLSNDNRILRNEQFRLGGMSSLRGFVDNQFFAAKYYYNNFEYRLYLEDKSFIRGFVDVGVVNEQREGNSFLTSFGIGLSVQVKSGVFNLIFANGQERVNSSLNFNNLIHFGYSSTF
jgi:outer membrane protein assembly factor BamA